MPPYMQTLLGQHCADGAPPPPPIRPNDTPPPCPYGPVEISLDLGLNKLFVNTIGPSMHAPTPGPSRFRRP